MDGSFRDVRLSAVLTQEFENCDAGIKGQKLHGIADFSPESEVVEISDEWRFYTARGSISERDKTGKGRLPNVGDMGGLRIPKIEQKSAKTAVFPVSVARGTPEISWSLEALPAETLHCQLPYPPSFQIRFLWIERDF
ncbi:MAG: hypothetical protein DWI29_00310 [Planctomycetota bacterium]|nr:MAG: hypothetical protein DWI29_00310 [Planctomycetota bacterium]